MKKASLVGLIILALAVPAIKAQNMAFSIGGGISSTRMDDMKYIQEHILDLYPVEGAVISSFPAYGMASVHLNFQIRPSLRIAGGINYSVTGARTNYTDSTGSLSTDMSASSSQFELAAFYRILGGKFYDISVFGSLGANLSQMDITSTLQVLGFGDLSRSGFQAISACGSAGLEAMIHLNSFSFGVEAGYNVDMPGKLKDTNSQKDFIDPDPGSERIMTTDWTGWQAQVKILLWLRN